MRSRLPPAPGSSSYVSQHLGRSVVSAELFLNFYILFFIRLSLKVVSCQIFKQKLHYLISELFFNSCLTKAIQ